jgi:cell division protein FtsQ
VGKISSSSYRGTRYSPPPLRKLLRATLLLSAAVSIFYGGPWIFRHSTSWGKKLLWFSGFKVQEIFVDGRHRTSLQTLKKTLGIQRGDFILDHSPQEIQKRVQKLPWVRSCLVERHLPNVFYIRLAERNPIAFWQKKGKKFLIDTEGKRIFCPVYEFPKGLLTVVGKEAPKFTEALLEILQKTPPLFAKRVVGALRLRSGRWDLYLDNNCCIKLPSQREEFALNRFITFEKKGIIRINFLEKIDLRFQDRVILTPCVPQGESQRT